MKRKPIETMILIDREGEQTAVTYHKLVKDGDGGMRLDVVKDNVYHRVRVHQTPDGMTELEYGSRSYRVLGVSYRVETRSLRREEHRYMITDSYDRALDLFRFIS